MTAPIRLATSRERPAVRSCATCVHRLKDRDWGVTCSVTGFFTDIERRYRGSCGPEGLLWELRPPKRPRPLRRSLARWIWDTFCNMGERHAR